MRFLPQISLRNLRRLDCYANRFPLRSKTLWVSIGHAPRMVQPGMDDLPLVPSAGPEIQ
jgi:hypothetical protein